MAAKCKVFFRSSLGELGLTLARPQRRRPRPVVAGEEVARPVPPPTHHPPCSVGKVEEMARRLAAGLSLWSPGDFIPTDPVMIERYVFNGRKASSYKVAELLASSPRNRSE